MAISEVLWVVGGAAVTIAMGVAIFLWVMHEVPQTEHLPGVSPREPRND